MQDAAGRFVNTHERIEIRLGCDLGIFPETCSPLIQGPEALRPEHASGEVVGVKSECVFEAGLGLAGLIDLEVSKAREEGDLGVACLVHQVAPGEFGVPFDGHGDSAGFEDFETEEPRAGLVVPVGQACELVEVIEERRGRVEAATELEAIFQSGNEVWVEGDGLVASVNRVFKITQLKQATGELGVEGCVFGCAADADAEVVGGFAEPAEAVGHDCRAVARPECLGLKAA